jgi:Cof subfamily protein (haloacid dehalogenase superfamily)
VGAGNAAVTAISLIISDVDGTLVDPDKRLTDASKRAVRRLQENGIGFTIVSSRPPFGLRMLVEPLSLQLPLGAINGCTIIASNLEPIEQHLVPAPVARQSVDMLRAFGVDVWLFTADDWLVQDLAGDYVPRERRAIQAEPRRTASFDPYLAQASKIVGSSPSFDKLGECEGAMRKALGGRASVVRSQPYYLDITAAGFGKGTFVEYLSRRLAIPSKAIAVLGDMENDLAMFGHAGLTIAMGNASVDVRRRARYVTASNADDGFAMAIERCILACPTRGKGTA